MCQVLNVSRSGYYAWVDRPPSVAERRRRELIEQICRVHEESFGTYGSPRTHAELIDRKIDVCVNTVANRTGSIGSSRRSCPTASGPATSPTSQRGKAFCTWRR